MDNLSHTTKGVPNKIFTVIMKQLCQTIQEVKKFTVQFCIQTNSYIIQVYVFSLRNLTKIQNLYISQVEKNSFNSRRCHQNNENKANLLSPAE